MTHLTLCGYEAGRPICGCNKAEELRAGAQFLHAMWAPVEKLTDLCPKCKAEWDACEPDNEPDPVNPWRAND